MSGRIIFDHWEDVIAARDAVIRAEQADLLKTCGGALEGIRTWVRPLTDGQILADEALAALKEAGVSL